jgi:cell division inhibitor SepF
MGFFDEIKKLTQPFDDEEEFFGEDDATTRIPVDRPHAQEKKSSYFSDGGDYELPSKPTFTRKDYRQDPAKVVSLNASAQLKVVLVKPERFEAAADIADHLRDKRAVVMNLEQTNKDIARRLIDFLSGVAYAQDGKIRRSRRTPISSRLITST